MILDITLPDGNGYSICTAVKRLTNAPVIFLTAMTDESSIITGFQLGADDYMTKPFKPMELIYRVRNALRKSLKAPSVFQIEDLHVDATKGNVVAVNIIWDSINSDRTDRQYVPFLNEGKEIVLNINGRDVPVSAFADDLPVLREELTQHALTLVMSESYYATLGFNLITEATIYTVKMTDESKNDVVEERLLGLLEAYPDYAFEGRVQELADEMQIQQGLRGIIYLFTVILTCIGLANIFASTLGQIHQRKREFARYFAIGLTPKGAAMILAWEAAIIALRPILLTMVINIPLMAWMLDAGGIAAGDFITKRLPLVPALALFAAVIVFVALAYYWGGKKICNMNLVEAIKDDTLML